ncbi:MAG: toll/interleukin-1 receptor domain-containing protein, partial [Verrucomicrobiota bacterium]|nr:toll/interleukin-1 receptor domain-containing protein [Verrucomicrobiota bacterium]
MPQGSHKYKAFISYSHQDKKWGDWLHKSLETYSIPKALIGKKALYGKVPKRLFPVFRDRDELPTATELGTVIDKALNDSSHLVVICSPRSAKSQWVNEEIKQFKRLGKADRILCLIVDGEPYGADKPEMGLEECFPEAVKYELGEDGELSEERTEPIAADAREGKDGKRNALLKLVAGLLGVGFDELKQRDAVRRQRRMMMVAGVSGVLALVMGALAIWAWDQRNEAVASRQAETQQRKVAETQRQEAVKQKGIAEEKRKEAETELQKATVVSEFVGGIFTAV